MGECILNIPLYDGFIFHLFWISSWCIPRRGHAPEFDTSEAILCVMSRIVLISSYILGKEKVAPIGLYVGPVVSIQIFMHQILLLYVYNRLSSTSFRMIISQTTVARLSVTSLWLLSCIMTLHWWLLRDQKECCVCNTLGWQKNTPSLHTLSWYEGESRCKIAGSVCSECGLLAVSKVGNLQLWNRMKMIGWTKPEAVTW